MDLKVSSQVNFGKALSTRQKVPFEKTIKEAKKVLGIHNGLSILKIHSGSMPYQSIFDSGIGKLNSQGALDFIKQMTFYTGTNAIKVFPAGQMTQHASRYYCPYTKTALSFGEDNINLLNIVQNKETYGNLLEMDDIKTLKNDDKSQNVINYESELMFDENYPILKPLKKAYDNFKKGLAPQKLVMEFEEFKQKPLVADKYVRYALYPHLKRKEFDLFENFGNSPEKQNKYNEYKNIYKNEIEFFQFRQFLAKKDLTEAKEKINKEGIKLFGDCLIGFAPQDVWSNPDAFKKNAAVGNCDWGLPSLNFEEILDPQKEAYKLFKDKITFFLENYDGIRFDVGWCYALAKYTEKGKATTCISMEHKLFDLIEQFAKEIKGQDYDTKNLIYELDGAGDLFDNWDGIPTAKSNIKDIVSVFTTQWQQDCKSSWGNPDFLRRAGLTDDEFILGTNNHDGSPLRALAEATSLSRWHDMQGNADVLSKLFGISKQILLDNPSEFIKAKFAQLYTVKNQFLFFIDVLGSAIDMDDQSTRTTNYRFRVDKNFERQYHTALQQGFGFNLPEALSLVFKLKNLDKSHPEIYCKLVDFARILREPGAKSETEANARERG